MRPSSVASSYHLATESAYLPPISSTASSKDTPRKQSAIALSLLCLLADVLCELQQYSTLSLSPRVAIGVPQYGSRVRVAHFVVPDLKWNRTFFYHGSWPRFTTAVGQVFPPGGRAIGRSPSAGGGLQAVRHVEGQLQDAVALAQLARVQDDALPHALAELLAELAQRDGAVPLAGLDLQRRHARLHR